jgi:hypothetical protein
MAVVAALPRFPAACGVSHKENRRFPPSNCSSVEFSTQVATASVAHPNAANSPAVSRHHFPTDQVALTRIIVVAASITVWIVSRVSISPIMAVMTPSMSGPNDPGRSARPAAPICTLADAATSSRPSARTNRAAAPTRASARGTSAETATSRTTTARTTTSRSPTCRTSRATSPALGRCGGG